MARRKKYNNEPIKQSKNVKNKDDLTADVYRGNYDYDELQRMRRALAKRANQRMVRLERSKSPVTGEQYHTFGAITEVYYYLNNQKEGRRRFREQLNALKTYDELRREITVLQGFLGRRTSLVSGMRDIERKRLETFATGRWGTRYKKTGILNRPLHFASNKEFYDFLNSETFKGLVSSGFTSEQIVEIYDSARVKVSSKGRTDDAEIIADKMAEALDEYREKGNASLKDLRRRMNSIKLKGSNNK